MLREFFVSRVGFIEKGCAGAYDGAIIYIPFIYVF